MSYNVVLRLPVNDMITRIKRNDFYHHEKKSFHCIHAMYQIQSHVIPHPGSDCYAHGSDDTDGE